MDGRFLVGRILQPGWIGRERCTICSKRSVSSGVRPRGRHNSPSAQRLQATCERFGDRSAYLPLSELAGIPPATLAALEATLRLYRDPAKAKKSVPVLAMLTADAEELKGDAEKYRQFSIGRAEAFADFMAKRTICINDGELIVGERGPAPKATPTYPELCCHTVQDLDILNAREKTSFAVSPQARPARNATPSIPPVAAKNTVT